MIESILSFNFSDKKIFPDTKEGYIYIYFSEILWEKGKLGQRAIALLRYRYREKMGRKEGAARDSRNAFDIGPTKNGSMWRESERRGDHRQLSRVIDRREIRPEISRSLSRFSPPSLAFLPDFLPPVIAIRTKKGKRKDRNYIYIIALQ